MRTVRVLFPVLVLVSALAAPAAAYDFTFTIPVQFTNLPPEVTQFIVGCVAQLPSSASVGQGNRIIPITGGAYTGDVTIQFNAITGMDPATATRYQCTAYFFGTVSAGLTPHYFESSYGPRFPLAVGAPFRLDTGVAALP
jgi:hypothetical protein